MKKKTYEQFGHYLPQGGNKNSDLKNALAFGKKKYNEIHIYCDLTDDADGKDFSWFKKFLRLSDFQHEHNCINKNNPNHIDLYMKRFDVNSEPIPTFSSEFKLNDYPIKLSNDSVLSIYSFMAQLARRIKEMPELSEAKRSCADFFNKSVHKEAVEYLDM